MQKVTLEPQQTERVPHSIRKLFKASGPGDCPRCGGPMKQRKAKLSVGENCETWDIQLPLCPKCDS
jgi:hypothetical protein